MSTPPIDPEGYRARQRRRALIGWAGGFLVLALVIGPLVLVHHHDGARRTFKVPYGDVMTSRDYEEIHLGEEDVVVLERLVETGRPENLTKEFVLVLFPPVPAGAYCVYWEFSDEPQIFARLCFSTDNGQLVDKSRRSVLHPPVGGQGTVV